MAQIGRISGPLLTENLERKGTVQPASQANLSFRKDNDSDVLLKIDVNNGRIGVDVDAPVNELQISDTLRTVNLIGDSTNVANYTISNNNIVVDSGDIYLNAGEHIQLSNLETEQFYASDNYISTKSGNTNIILNPDGNGKVEIFNNLNVFGNLYTPGNITFEGSITFGDAGQIGNDTVDFNAEVTNSLIPDQDNLYKLGNSTKAWKSIYGELVSGQLITSGAINVNDIILETRPGNIFYVATNGNDTNVGDHIQGPLATIEEALSRCEASTAAPTVIHVFPGTYAENLPLVLPANVSIVGHDIRNTIIVPASGSESKDVFHLSDSSTVTNVTIKDFYYDNLNNTGYAFRFAPGAVITGRSPYVQNITVITKGSVVTVDDPRGFASGDAGKGAYINGAELDSASVEASMLFHSATFITPGVDAITMTNGVRVEWLNSFTYFANRGLYAVRGLTGRTSYDGSTVNYGAEVRSIGSASVYGNYGAVADGNDTLMYLIQHNFGYIGSGKYSDNDPSRANQNNEVVELNSGRINYVTTDHLGAFRVGDNFFVDFETGSTSVDISTLSVNQLTGLVITTGNNTTTIDGAFIETGNINITDNLIEVFAGDLNIASASGKINLQDNTNITGNLDITGNLSYGGTLNIKGDETTDSLTFNVEFEQDFNPHQHLTFDLGSFQKQWLIAHLDRIESGDFSIYDNVIETNVSNADLELRANGTGKIYIPDNATFSNALTVSGLTTINNGAVINDSTFTHIGNFVQTGNRSLSEDIIIGQNLIVGARAQFENIKIDDNVISTTITNSDLELRASGSGTVNIQEDLEVTNNLTADNITAQTNVTVTLNTSSDNAIIGGIEINDNYIRTISGNNNLILESTRDVVVIGADTNFQQDLTVNGASDFQGVSLTGTLAHVGNVTQTGAVTLAGDLTNGDLTLNDNVVFTKIGNNDLILIASGTGNVSISNNDVEITNDLTVSGLTSLQNTSITGQISHSGNRNQTGNYSQGGELIVDNLYFEDNFINATSGNLVLEATGDITVPLNNTEITQDLTVSGTTTLQDLSVTGQISHSGNRNQTGNYLIGGEFTVDNIYIEDNFIVTTGVNQDLELRASGTGKILVPTDNVEITNNLTVNGIVNLKNTSVTGTLTQTGDRNQTGNYAQTGNLITDTVNFQGDVQFTDIKIFDNVITTTIGNNDLDLRASGSGQVLIQNTDLRVTNNLFTASIDTTNITVAQDLILDELVIRDSNIEIAENYISTKTSNSDLELRATGNVEVPNNNTIIEQDLTVNGTTNLKNTNIVGPLTLTGNRTQTGNYSLTGNLNISSLTTSQTFQFDNIRIRGNVLESTLSNSDLELRAAGVGDIIFNDNLQVNRNLNTGTFNVNAISVVRDVALETIELSTDVQFFDNVITTTNSNSNLELRANGTGSVFLENLEFDGTTVRTASSNIVLTPANNLILNSTNSLRLPLGTTLQERNVIGDVRFNTNDNVFEGTTNLERITFNGVYSQDRRTSVIAHPTNNTIGLTVNAVAVGTIASTGLTIHGLQVEDILLNNNSIITNASNSDLELITDGTGELVLNNISLVDNNIKNDGSNIIFQSTNFGRVKFDGPNGIVVPSGTTAEQPLSAPPVGDTRWNTDTQLLETWDGNQYITSGGIATAISRQEYDDLLLEYTLIFG